MPARFEYVAPPDVPSCVEALGVGARVLAGGTWVLPEMGRGESSPDRLVDLRRAGLGAITDTGSTVLVGATATYADVLASATVARRVPLLRLMASGITGGWALRNQATLGGSAASARPQSDVPATLLAAGASVLAAGPDGERRLPARELFVAAMVNGLRPGELLVGFELPVADDAGRGYVKVKRGASSWPIATAASTLRLDADGTCASVSLALGGVAAVPLGVDVAALLVGRIPTDDLLARAADHAAGLLVDPWSDALAPADYRAAVAGPVARRALTMAREDARTRREEHAGAR